MSKLSIECIVPQDTSFKPMSPFYLFVIFIFGRVLKIGFYLTYNQGTLGEQGAYFLREDSNKNVVILLACISGFIILSYIILIRKAPLKVIYKVLIGVALFLTLSVAMEMVRPLLGGFSITSWTASIMHKITGSTIYSLLFY